MCLGALAVTRTADTPLYKHVNTSPNHLDLTPPTLPRPQVLVRLLNITPQEVERIIAGAAKAKAKQRSGMAQGMASVANVGSSAADMLMGQVKQLGSLLPPALQQQLQSLDSSHSGLGSHGGLGSHSSFSNR